MLKQNITNALTIDFEDWYQGLEIPCKEWSKFEDRIESSCDKLLSILDETTTRATFFILGYTSEQFPELIGKIRKANHEIATHGFSHTLIYKQTPKVFRTEMERAVKFLEDKTGEKILGHRAPFFSITKDSIWALDILGELGIKYDSSIYPVLNYRYGINGTPRFPYIIKGKNYEIKEFPVSTFKVSPVTVPVAGGAYFRIYPYLLSKSFLKMLNAEGHAFTFYLHPWEIDPQHPRINLPSRISTTHYFNLAATERRFRRLLRDFKFAPMRDVFGFGGDQEKHDENLQSISVAEIENHAQGKV